ncbi:RHS repeat domain-containing protein, partial [Undibacterium flavidum]
TGSTGSPTSITKTYTYDGRNQLTAITDTAAGNTTLSYDSQGNLSQKIQGSDSTYYSYNARDNLISVRKNNTVLGNYSNNHLGLRVEKEAKDPLQPN